MIHNHYTSQATDLLCAENHTLFPPVYLQTCSLPGAEFGGWVSPGLESLTERVDYFFRSANFALRHDGCDETSAVSFNLFFLHSLSAARVEALSRLRPKHEPVWMDPGRQVLYLGTGQFAARGRIKPRKSKKYLGCLTRTIKERFASKQTCKSCHERD